MKTSWVEVLSVKSKVRTKNLGCIVLFSILSWLSKNILLFSGPSCSKDGSCYPFDIYPVEKATDSLNTCPLDGDLSSGYHNPSFEQVRT